MPLKLRIFHKGMLLVSVPLIFELMFIAILITLQHSLEMQLQREAHSKAVIYHANQLFIDLVTAVTERLGATVPGLRIHNRRDIIENQRESVAGEVRTLRVLVRDNPGQEAALERICAVTDEMRESLEELSAQPAGGGGGFGALMGSLTVFRQMETALNVVKEAVDRFTAPEAVLSEEIAAEQIKTRQLICAVLGCGVAVNVIIAFAIAMFFSQNITSRLQMLVDNTRRLTAGETLRPEVSGSDEIAALDRVFHDMADALADASAKERAIVSYAQEVICCLDADGRFTRLNPASEKVWGFKAEELIGKSVLEMVVADDLANTRSALSDVIARGASTSLENRLSCKDGASIDMLWSVYWSEKEKSLFCVVYNISERKQIERLKQEFYSMITHDLRSPLTAVFGMIKLLDAGAFGQLPELARTKLVVAERNVERLLTLINDLLDIEKLESGKMPLEKRATDMASVVEQSVQAVETSAQRKQIELIIDCPPITCFADGGRLVQVTVNLLSNAIKFSPEKSSITISCGLEGDHVCLSVKDQGRGIPAHLKESIFKRFEQVAVADSRRNAGTGLGLSICQQIIEAHQGEIGVQSEEGKGSTFWFKIPLAEPEESGEPVPGRIHSVEPGSVS